MTTLSADALSPALKGPFPTNERTIAEGPFVVDHGGVRTLGAHLEQSGPEYIVFNGDRVLSLDATYEIEIEDNGSTLRATSTRYHSTITLRALTEDDYVLLGEDAEQEDLESLFFTAYNAIRVNGIGGDETVEARLTGLVAAAAPPAGPEYGITLDDDGSVLELVKFDADGGAIRDAGNWLPLDPNAEENDDDTVFGREWVDVDEGAVAVYDENADADSLTKDIFIPHILN